MFDFLKQFFKREKPKTLKEMFDRGLITKEKFLRFTIIEKEIDLERAKGELKGFLNKQKK